MTAGPAADRPRKADSAHARVLVSYHGAHSRDYCSHATDSLAEILDAYVAAGFRYVAVTEHLPSQEGFLYPEEKPLGAAALATRFQQLMDKRPELHSKYDRQFSDFRVGFETEFYGKDPLGHVREMIDRCHPEIVVASVHHVRGISIDFSLAYFQQAVTVCGSVESLVGEYYDQQYRLIQALAEYTRQFPVVLGHMDIVRLYQGQAVPELRPGRKSKERIERNIRTAVAGGLVFELSSRGFAKGVGTYPDKDMLEAIARLGGRITLGDDAHAANEVGLHYAEGVKVAKQFFPAVTVFEAGNDSSYLRREILL